jgi:hypothetical protein
MTTINDQQYQPIRKKNENYNIIQVAWKRWNIFCERRKSKPGGN